MQTSYTLTHTYEHRRASTHIIIHTSIKFYANTQAYVNIHTYTLTHAHTHTHTCTQAQALTHTCAQVLTRTCAYKTKMHSQYYTHRYTHMLTHTHEQALAHRIYRPTHKHTLVHSYLRVRLQTRRQHASTCALARRRANMPAHGHSCSHIHTR